MIIVVLVIRIMIGHLMWLRRRDSHAGRFTAGIDIPRDFSGRQIDFNDTAFMRQADKSMIAPGFNIRHDRAIDFFLDIVGERTGHLQCMKKLPRATITNFQAPVVSQDKQKISVGRRALAHRSGDFHSIKFKRLPSGIQAVNHWQRTLGIPPDYLVLAIIEIANALIIRIWDTRNCRMCFRPGRADH